MVFLEFVFVLNKGNLVQISARSVVLKINCLKRQWVPVDARSKVAEIKESVKQLMWMIIAMKTWEDAVRFDMKKKQGELMTRQVTLKVDMRNKNDME